MLLREAINLLDTFAHDAHIFACSERPLHADSFVHIGNFTEEDEPPVEAQGLREFLDVWHAKDLLQGKERLLKIEEPLSPDQRIELFLSILEHDA